MWNLRTPAEERRDVPALNMGYITNLLKKAGIPKADFGHNKITGTVIGTGFTTERFYFSLRFSFWNYDSYSNAQRRDMNTDMDLAERILKEEGYIVERSGWNIEVYGTQDMPGRKATQFNEETMMGDPRWRYG
jgi:hypothetical protein